MAVDVMPLVGVGSFIKWECGERPMGKRCGERAKSVKLNRGGFSRP